MASDTVTVGDSGPFKTRSSLASIRASWSSASMGRSSLVAGVPHAGEQPLLEIHFHFQQPVNQFREPVTVAVLGHGSGLLLQIHVQVDIGRLPVRVVVPRGRERKGLGFHDGTNGGFTYLNLIPSGRFDCANSCAVSCVVPSGN